MIGDIAFTHQFVVSLELLLSRLPILPDGRFGCYYPIQHLAVILYDLFCLVAIRTGPLLLSRSAISTQGALPALVYLGQARADAVVCRSHLVFLHCRFLGGLGLGREPPLDGDWGLGGEYFEVVLFGEELSFEGPLSSHENIFIKGCRQSVPLEYFGHSLLDLALNLQEISTLYPPIELLNICVLSVLLEVGKGLDDHDEVLLLLPLHLVDGFSQLELVATDGLFHESSPVVVVDLLKLELPLHVVAAALDVLLVGEELHADDLQVRSREFDELLVLGVAGELAEVGRELEEVDSLLEGSIEGLHVVVGLLADDEERDEMVGVDVVEVEDVGSDVLEDEHDVVPLVQVYLLVSLDCVGDLLSLLVHLLHLLEIHRDLLFHLLDLLRRPLLVGVALGVDQVFVNLELLLVEVPIVGH